jgi:hypothetical protein
LEGLALRAGTLSQSFDSVSVMPPEPFREGLANRPLSLLTQDFCAVRRREFSFSFTPMSAVITTLVPTKMRPIVGLRGWGETKVGSMTKQ